MGPMIKINILLFIGFYMKIVEVKIMFGQWICNIENWLHKGVERQVWVQGITLLVCSLALFNYTTLVSLS